MPAPEVLVLALLILAAALLYASVGHAGASGYIAAMALLGLNPTEMRPIALALNVLVATVTAFNFARAGAFSWPLFWPFALASVPCAYLGGALSLPAPAYKAVVGVVLLYAAFRLFRASFRAALTVSPPPLPAALAAGAAIGLLSGLTGVGGGIFLSPLLLLMGWADARRTAGVSSAFILVNSVAALAGLRAGLGALPPALPVWAAAALAGGWAGSWWGSRRLGNEAIRRLLSIVLTIAGIKMLLA